jgi:hypothetical protein
MDMRGIDMSKTLGLWVLAFLAVAVPASAQSITKWTIRVYAVGAAQPLSAPVDLVMGEDVTCGVDAAAVTATPSDPVIAAWKDPSTPGKVCVYSDRGDGPLRSTPLQGPFEVTLTASNGSKASPESARVLFSKPTATAVGDAARRHPNVP